MIVTGVAQREAWARRVLPPVERVRPGVWSVPVPIPRSPLRYTLTYLFVDDPGIVVVDPGWDSAEGRAALEAGLRAAGGAAGDVTGIVVTHVHPDHHGLSGWLRERSGAWIGMHPLEAASLPQRTFDAAADRAWLRRHGVPDADADLLAIDRARLGDLLRMPAPDRPIEDGDAVRLGRHELHAVWTPGHTPGHLCLHEAGAGVLLTGDHLLPRISPNIGVHAATDGDPLGAYLASLEQTAKFAGEEALPGHEYRFRGLDARAAALARHHDERGGEILAIIAATGPATAWDVAARLTWSRGWASLRGMLRRMALAETLAHLRHIARPAGDTPTRWHAHQGS